MKLYFTLSRKILVGICMAIVLCLLIVSRLSQARHIYKDAATNELRVEYISSFGYPVNETAKHIKNTEIPYDFSPEYSEYNEIQRQTGFDLTAYKGCKVTVYSYEINGAAQNERAFITLIVYNGRVIGADVYKSQNGGSILPLKKLE